jgi:hypothetical protein
MTSTSFPSHDGRSSLPTSDKVELSPIDSPIDCYYHLRHKLIRIYAQLMEVNLSAAHLLPGSTYEKLEKACIEIHSLILKGC